jgi:mRNA degradation ribonuclease J1/J2
MGSSETGMAHRRLCVAGASAKRNIATAEEQGALVRLEKSIFSTKARPALDAALVIIEGGNSQ